MTEDDRSRFAEILTALAETYGEELSAARLRLYFAALQDLDIEQVEFAGEKIAGASRFFPRPVEFREVIEGSAEDRAAVAWRTFLEIAAHSGYPSLQLADGALAFAIEEMGGYREAVEKIHEASAEMQRAHQKSFEQFYKIGKMRGAPGKYLLGEFEARNRSLQSWITMRNGKPVQAFEVQVQVLLVGTDRFFELKMPLDLRTGQLAAPAREALAAGGDALRAYLPAPTARQIGAGATLEEERATPAEIAEIYESVAVFTGQRRLTRRLLRDEATPEESAEAAASA